MKRALITNALICALAVGVAGKPNKAAAEKQQTPNPQGQPTLTVHNEKTTTDCADHSDDNPPNWHATIKRPECWLVLIAALTGFVIYLQTREMAKATKAMERSTEASEKSIRLQEIQLQQWVDVTGWGSMMSEDRKNLYVRFEIVNPTNFPLTITESSVVFELPGMRITYSLADHFHLSPNIPKPVEIEIRIFDEQVKRFLEERLIFSVHGTFLYTDMGRNTLTTQALNGKLRCGRAVTRFDPETITPTEANYKRQNPN